MVKPKRFPFYWAVVVSIADILPRSSRFYYDFIDIIWLANSSIDPFFPQW